MPIGGGASVLVKFLADTSQVSAAAGQVENAGGRVKKGFAGVGRIVGSAMAVTAVTGFAAASVKAAQESEVATARLAQVFKSMGDETGTAAKEAEAYASSLSAKIGVEDEAIMQSQALLATFSNVSNETARQAGTFDRATKAAADLAATGFGSMDTNAKMLGKALQDPVKGMTALNKAGVTFTAGQKAQIAAMVEAGDVAGAQALILKEVEKQVGGVAEATATGGQKMSVAFGEMQEQVGKALLPTLQKLTPIITSLISVLTPFAPVLLAVAAAFIVLNAATMLMAANPIVLIILGIVVALVALGAAIVYLYQHSETFRNIVNAVWETVSSAFQTAISAMASALDWLRDAISGVLGWIKGNWPLLIGIMLGPLGIIVALVITHWSQIRSAITTALDAIKSAVTAAWGIIQSVIQTAVGAAKAVIDSLIAAFNTTKAAVTTLAAVVQSTLATAFNTAKEAATTLANILRGALEAAANTAKGALSGLSGIVSAIAGAFQTAAGAVGGLIDAISRIPSKINLPSLPSIPGLGRAAPSPASGPMAMPTAGAFTRAAGVSPAAMQRSSASGLSVRVYIGDTELRGLVRTVVTGSDTQLARSLLAGSRR